MVVVGQWQRAVLWNGRNPVTGKESRMHQREEGANTTKGGKRAV